ncbi:UNVERIFIED_CONTAM: hypothetical protein Sradi_4388800 [Sesamum radiatum]|uniref:Uncharacterized protein n=1 Tax=Sesamum radiatum TaxID=300843 RepID=A0AAW2NPZ6_SESRA
MHEVDDHQVWACLAKGAIFILEWFCLEAVVERQCSSGTRVDPLAGVSSGECKCDQA